MISDAKKEILRTLAVRADIDPDNAKIAGSFLLQESYNDIDVFVSKDDDITLAKLLHIGSVIAELHIVAIPQDIFDDLHNKMSWCQCCKTMTLSGRLSTGRMFTESPYLKFNIDSVKAFPSLSKAHTAMTKLTTSVYHISKIEELRMAYYIGQACHGKDALLVSFARTQLGDTICQMLIESRAIIAGGYFRDIVMGKKPKDMDVFVPLQADAWNRLCNDLAAITTEIHFTKQGSKVNLRKFIIPQPNGDDLILDVIDYGFVSAKEHVVETFDFSINCLWTDLQNKVIQGGLGFTARDIINHITDKKLYVGDNLWFCASLGRALMRWQRFRNQGFTANAIEQEKYSKYVHMINHKTRKKAPSLIE